MIATQMSEPLREDVILLPDLRRLAYAEYGDPNGRPLFFFHGFPGSRYEAALGAGEAAARNIRIIAPDRPGSGLSDYQPRRRILDWPHDVVRLADTLGIERFGVAGISGGGPYAAACAYAIPERLTGAAIISGVGPFDAPGATDGMSRQNRAIFWLASKASWLTFPPLFILSRAVRGSPDRLAKQMMTSMPESDRELLRDPAIQEMFVRDAREAVRPGLRGAMQEASMYARPWGFRLQDIRMRVHVWQGGKDTNVPPSMGRWQAKAIPDCVFTFYEDEGHLLGLRHLPDIGEAVLADTN